jgi:hypothetical protein
MVTELTPAQAPPATSQPPCPRHPTPWQVTNRQFETLHRGLVRQAIFPLRRFDCQKLEARVATLIQRKPALPALRKLSPRNLKAWANPEFVPQPPAQIEASSAWQT